MQACCVEAFALWGLSTGFQPAFVGERFSCPTCHTVFEMRDVGADDGPKWTQVERREADDVLDQFNLRELPKRVH